MPDKILGDSYGKTVGQIIDYCALADFLINKTNLPSRCKVFGDAPCGDGELLKQIECRLPKLPLFGIDMSCEQLAVAKAKKVRAQFILGDLFRLSHHLDLFSYNKAFVHFGFCFMNVLNTTKRNKLLKELYNCCSISEIGIEIQNESYNERTYLPGRWHVRKLLDGTILSVRPDCRMDGGRSLSMKFEKDGVVISQEATLYPWEIDQCVKDLAKAGWLDPLIKPAEYRSESNGASHWFIIAKRK
jgi:hypothetical protein